MGRRAPTSGQKCEPIFGPPATNPKEAFVRLGNALRWEMDLGEVIGADRGSAEAFLWAALARMKRAEHYLVARFITELTGGGYTFAEAQAVWKRTWSDRIWFDWRDPSAFLRFLLVVRDTIDPHAWPASKPRFRPDPASKEARPGKR